MKLGIRESIDKIKTFSRIFVERPRFAMVIAIVLTMAGVMSITWLPISQYPRLTPPSISVMYNYPGANAKEILNTVAMPIEDEVNGVDDMLYMVGSCSDTGNYQLQVSFEVESDRDMDMVKVQNRVAQAEAKHARRDLPPLAEGHDVAPADIRLHLRQHLPRAAAHPRRGRGDGLRPEARHARVDGPRPHGGAGAQLRGGDRRRHEAERAGERRLRRRLADPRARREGVHAHGEGPPDDAEGVQRDRHPARRERRPREAQGHRAHRGGRGELHVHRPVQRRQRASPSRSPRTSSGSPRTTPRTTCACA